MGYEEIFINISLPILRFWGNGHAKSAKPSRQCTSAVTNGKSTQFDQRKYSAEAGIGFHKSMAKIHV